MQILAGKSTGVLALPDDGAARQQPLELDVEAALPPPLAILDILPGIPEIQDRGGDVEDDAEHQALPLALFQRSLAVIAIVPVRCNTWSHFSSYVSHFCCCCCCCYCCC